MTPSTGSSDHPVARDRASSSEPMTPSTGSADHTMAGGRASSGEPTDHLVFHDRVPVGLAIGWAAVAFIAAVLATVPLWVAVPTLTALAALAALTLLHRSNRRARRRGALEEPGGAQLVDCAIADEPARPS
jgi:hypothetical protein